MGHTLRDGDKHDKWVKASWVFGHFVAIKSNFVLCTTTNSRNYNVEWPIWPHSNLILEFWHHCNHWRDRPFSRQASGVARPYRGNQRAWHALIVPDHWFLPSRCAFPLWYVLNIDPYCFGVPLGPETHSKNSETLFNGPINILYDYST